MADTQKLLVYMHVHETHTVGAQGVDFDFNPKVTEVIVAQGKFRAAITREGMTYHPERNDFDADEQALFEGTYRSGPGYATKAVKTAQYISDDKANDLEQLIRRAISNQEVVRSDSAMIREMLGDQR